MTNVVTPDLRAVLETNIHLRSILRTSSASGRIVAALEEGRFTLIASEPLFAELTDVLTGRRLTRWERPGECGGCWLKNRDREMPAQHEIRADFDRDTITIYQAYSPAIADAALNAGRFVSPFSLHRMTWIKPSLLWLMHRSNWGQKSGQERTLAVRITRSGWEKALSRAVLTHFEPSAFRSPEEWAAEFAQAEVHLQWDPERSLRGASLPYYSIQVGLSRQIIHEYVDEWITQIEDLTPRVRKIHDLLKRGEPDKAKRHLPGERIYPVGPELARRLLVGM